MFESRRFKGRILRTFVRPMGEVAVAPLTELLRHDSDIPVEELDDLMIHCLHDDASYVHALALEALTRPRRGEDRPGLRHSLHYLKAHRWDHMLAHGKRIF